jgi:hypothetical protein
MESQPKQVVVPTEELLAILGVVQVASGRGAFRPEEFVQIGTAYQKLHQFLSDLGAITQPQTEEPGTPIGEEPGTASGQI